MMTREKQTAMDYEGVVENLLAIRDQAREGNGRELKAINSILASVLAMQLIDRLSRIPVGGARNSTQPLPLGTAGRASNKAPISLTGNCPKFASACGAGRNQD